jgi:hypothetical protein
MDKLLSDIQAFCETHKIAATRFGEMAMNDKPFVAQLENGRRLWPETEAKVRRFMETYRSESAAA